MSTTRATSETAPREAARARLNAYLATNGKQRHLVYVAAKLGLADLLPAEPKSVGEIAVAVGAHADTLRGVLRGMVADGLLTSPAPGCAR